jgi:sugar-specific transcriptional regulator TrmB
MSYAGDQDSIFFFLSEKRGQMKLSREWMVKTLQSFELKRLDVEVYLHLVQHDPQKAKDIAEALETYKRQLYRSLKNLQRKGMVSASQEHPARFSAVTFDRVLDKFMEANREEAQHIEENKEQILSMWRSKIMGEG